MVDEIKEETVKRNFSLCALAALAIEMRFAKLYSSKMECPILSIIAREVATQTGDDLRKIIKDIDQLMVAADKISSQTGRDIVEVVNEMGQNEMGRLMAENEQIVRSTGKDIDNQIVGRERFDTKTTVDIELTKKQALIVDTMFSLMDRSLKPLCG